MQVLWMRLFPVLRDPKAEGVRQRVGMLSGALGIGCNLVLVITKLAAGILAGSVAIIADALNNLGDIGSSVVTLLGFRVAGKPADPEHPFGHGRAEYMGGFVVALLICLMGFQLLETSFGRIGSPEPMAVTALTLAVLVFAMLVKLFMFGYNSLFAKTIGSAALRGTALDSLSDVAATGSVLVSALLYRFAGLQIDAYVGMGVAAFIIFTGIKTAMETGDLLLGQYTDPGILAEITERVTGFDARILGTHDLMVHTYGPGRRFAYLDLELPSDLSPQEAHALIDACEREVGRAMGITLTIHMDPVDIRDSRLTALRREVEQHIQALDPCLCFHDLRLLGEEQNALSFELVLPHGHALSCDEAVLRLTQQIQALHPDLSVHIGIEWDLSLAEQEPT